MDRDEVLKTLETSPEGLSAEEAENRLKEYGPNEIKERKKPTAIAMFLGQFKDFLIIVLIGAAIASGVVGEPADTIAIIAIVLLNAALGFSQEYRAEKAIAALKLMAAPSSVVIRGGVPAGIATGAVVPGDIVTLEAGAAVPADLRLIEVSHLKVEEAALTGESVPVEKETKTLHEPSLPIGDRKNMAWKGTVVTYGRGKGVAVSTGMTTELGAIASMLQEEEEVKTPLQRRLGSFGQKIAMAIFVICAGVFSIGILRGEPPAAMFLTAISLAVAAIPAALPAVVTISLALGAKKMSKRNVLIRKLPAVEALGSTTYICSDKTGTLTMNEMTVEEVYADGKISSPEEFPLNEVLFTALALGNDARRDASGNILGDPTEVSLYKAALEGGFDKRELEKRVPRTAEIPFDSERKCMTTIHRAEDGKYLAFTKGAVEVLVEKSVNILESGEFKKIDRGKILKAGEKMAADGLRVLAVSMKKMETAATDDAETGLTLLGLIGLMDPVRPGAQEAVSICKTAGIKPVMITGDHLLTARSIARRLGIIEDDAKAGITGAELERLSLEELEERVEKITVYARVAPEQKLKIVRALQGRGQFVAMTGDGVNDAPALKRADIGVAMGITGTDVSKEAAHMILLDDNFSTIVGAVKQGRLVYDNIRKFIKYLLSTNSGELWTIFIASITALPMPLLPIQILWINLVTDGLPALALSAEPPEEDLLKRPPRHPQESIFAHGLVAHALWVGLLMGFMTIFTQVWALGKELTHWQTMTFTVLCLSQIGHALAIRSERESLFTRGFLSNKSLVGALILTFALQMAIVYVPALNPVFKTAPLTARELVIALALSSVVFFAVEAEKLLRREKWKK